MGLPSVTELHAFGDHLAASWPRDLKRTIVQSLSAAGASPHSHVVMGKSEVVSSCHTVSK
jgi:hypothetical protein